MNYSKCPIGDWPIQEIGSTSGLAWISHNYLSVLCSYMTNEDSTQELENLSGKNTYRHASRGNHPGVGKHACDTTDPSPDSLSAPHKERPTGNGYTSLDMLGISCYWLILARLPCERVYLPLVVRLISITLARRYAHVTVHVPWNGQDKKAPMSVAFAKSWSNISKKSK
jgi:hypothetical protein